MEELLAAPRVRDVDVQDRESLDANPALHTGRLLTVGHLVSTSAEKLLLAEQYDAVACDMETMAVANVCCRERVRFLSVRIISDAVDVIELNHCYDQEGRLIFDQLIFWQFNSQRYEVVA